MDIVKEFILEVANDQQFANRLIESQSTEQFLQIAEEKGFKLTEQDIRDLKNYANVVDKKYSGEALSDDEIALVAGGTIDYIREKALIIKKRMDDLFKGIQYLE